MATSSAFIIDCPVCNAKVAASERGRAEKTGWIDEIGEPFGARLLVGICPSCASLLAGESQQTGFEGHDSYEDHWSDVVRVFPDPPKTFSSNRVPKVVKDSLIEADRSLQANANIAACVMLGRALEALCRDVLECAESTSDAVAKAATKPKKKVMLGEGIKKLREKKVIDDRLFDWSQQLHAFRNLAAHPEDISISREDAADLQTFVYAIVEYVYDLADRYEEFKKRLESRSKRKKS
jgi:hypothetical protein